MAGPKRIALVVMGVSGSGKSTVAAGIAEALGLGFIDGDGLHSPESVARMQAGTPLTDDDRWPWLARIAANLADEVQWPAGLVIACSALRRVYRDRIRAGAPGVRFVFLDGPAEAATTCRKACLPASCRRSSRPAPTSPTCSGWRSSGRPRR